MTGHVVGASHTCPVDYVVIRRDGDWQSLGEDISGGLGGLVDRALMAAHGAMVTGGVQPPGGEVVVVLSDDAHVQSLNDTYRGVNAPTNVLAFPAGPTPRVDGAGAALGDVVLAWQTLMREAGERHIHVGDHLAHLTVHGYLHLCGYNHLNPDEATVMEALEVDALGAIGVANPYQTRS